MFLNFLLECRVYIAHYIRYTYCLEPLSHKNRLSHFAIDESLFTHLDGIQIWILGMINNESNAIRLDIINQRDCDILKKLINTHIMPGNYLITDSWSGYSFLDDSEEGYINFSFNHSLGNFGSRLLSTSRIESVWSELKSIIKKIYSTIRSKNFIYFLKESEYRRPIKNLTNIGKSKILLLLFLVLILGIMKIF